jgi:hypothetical protein
MRTRATTTLVAVLLAALTACSSGDVSDDAAPASTGEVDWLPETRPAADPDVAQAVMNYTTAYFAGDADTAYETLSDRCQKSTTPQAHEAAVRQALADYGPDHPAKDVQTDVRGELALVSYKVHGLPKLDQHKQRWVFEIGDWKYDAC